MYSSALTISRNSIVAGRPGPPVSASRSNGSSTAHWASVRSLGYPKRLEGGASGTSRLYTAMQQLPLKLAFGQSDYTKYRMRSKTWHDGRALHLVKRSCAPIVTLFDVSK